MSRPSYLQMEKLVQFLEENPGIAKGHIRSVQARQQTKRKWQEVTILLNSLGGATKDYKSWAKVWADKKYGLKRLLAQRNVSAFRTGGGIDNLPPLSEMDERLIFIMGGSSFAQGDQELSVPLSIPSEPEGPLPQRLDNSEVFIYDEPMPSTSQAVQPATGQAPATAQAPATNQTPATSQTPAPSTPRRSPRVRPRRLQPQQNQLLIERQRLIRIEEKRVEAEVTNAAGWRSLVQSIDNLANAIIIGAETIAQAMQNPH